MKPDDILQDVLAEAHRVMVSLDIPGNGLRRNRIARAILAAEQRGAERERERCAAEARTTAQNWLMEKYGAKSVPDDLRLLPAHLATAIRKDTP